MKRTNLVVLALSTTALLASACAKEAEAPVETVEVAEPAAPAIDFAAPATLGEGFATPESVAYDADQDVYFVSNINGQPLEADDNGYISKINAADRSVEARWIDGANENVELHAPKGMAIVGTELWVTDINQIRKFDKTTGQFIAATPIEGATFLNDLSAAADGSVYVSDSGMTAAAEGFAPNGSDQVYKIAADGTVTKLATDVAGLNGPNGLLVEGSNVWVASFRGNELYRLANGVKTDAVTLPAGSLDGIVQTPTGSLLVSSWDGNAVYEGTVGGTFTPLVENVQSPADLGIDTKRNLVLIPSFSGNLVEIRPLTAPATPTDVATADPSAGPDTPVSNEPAAN